MKIYCILLEDYVFHPVYLHRLAQRLHGKICGVSIVMRGARKPNLRRDIKEFFSLFGFLGVLLLAVQRFLYIAIDLSLSLTNRPSTFSLSSVCTLHSIPVVFVKDVNNHKHIVWVKTFTPDII